MSVNNTPDRIICNDCQRNLASSHYLDTDLRRVTRDPDYSPTCKQCVINATNAGVGNQRDGRVMQCSQCDEILPVSSFSARQRKEPELARCLHCIGI